MRLSFKHLCPILLFTLAQVIQPTCAQTVINVPDDDLPEVVKPGQTLNLYDLGLLEQDLTVQAYGNLNIYDGSTSHDIIAVPQSTISLYGGTLREIEPFDDNSDGLDHVTVNVYGGDSYSMQVKIGSGSVLNVSGGMLNSFDAYEGSIINISGGYAGDFGWLKSGSTVNITGGALGPMFDIDEGSTINLFDGELQHSSYIYGQLNMQGGELGVYSGIGSNGSAIMSGGRFGDHFKTTPDASLTLIGNSFMLDGVPVAGLDTIGNTVDLNIPEGSTLTGSLSDGSVFIISPTMEDKIADGTLTLQAGTIPTQTHYNVPSDPAPFGLLPGQSLTLAEGGSIVNCFAAVDATMNITGGVAGSYMEWLNSQVTISGGEVRSFTAMQGTHVDIQGGNVTRATYQPGTSATISGGAVGSMIVEADSQITVTGGAASYNGSLKVLAGGEVEFFGGSFGGLRPEVGASITLHGGQFMVDGVPIEGLDSIGDSITYTPTADTYLTGILADGTVILIDGSMGTDSAPLTLTRAAIPQVTQQVFNVPTDPAPRGLTAGQKAYIYEGGTLGYNFVAIDADIEVHGGKVNDNLRLIRTDLTVTDGSLGVIYAGYDSHLTITGGQIQELNLYDDTSADISGGTFEWISHRSPGVLQLSGDVTVSRLFSSKSSQTYINGGSYINNIRVAPEGTLVIDGGTIDADIALSDFSKVILNGGTVNGSIYHYYYPYEVQITGGIMNGYISLIEGAKLTISGGEFNGIIHISGGGEYDDLPRIVNLIGTSFTLDGIDLTADMLPGETLLLTDRNAILEGFLADGSPITLDMTIPTQWSYEDNYLPEEYVNITITLVPEPATLPLFALPLLLTPKHRR